MFSVIRDIFPRGLHRRFLIWFAGMFVVSASFCFFLAYYHIADSLRETDIRLITTKHQELSALLLDGNFHRLEEHFNRPESQRDKDIFFVKLANPSGETLFVNFPEEYLDDFAMPTVPITTNSDRFWEEIPSDEPEENLELLSVKLPSGHWLQVGNSTEEREDLLEEFQETFLNIGAVLLLLGLIGGDIFTRRALRPIRELADTVTAIKNGHFSTRVPTSNNDDDFEKLKRLFNGMLDQTENLIKGMRETTDALAHDVRTPLTRLRAHAELALKAGKSDEERGEALITAIENVDHIIALTNTIMDVSEAESRVMPLKLESVPLGNIFKKVSDLYKDLAEEKTLTFNVESTDLFVTADAVRLQQALANLVDNAIKYSRPGDQISLAASATTEFVTVTVEDTGPGIPKADLPRIWTRLFRGDASRSEKGMGLGLSMVKAIAELHGGRAEVESTIDEGSIFRLILPQTNITNL